MPIYEYQCKSCEHQFDEIQKVDAPPLTDCPECKEASLVKLISAPSFRLKGSGWYETDFKKDNRRNLAESGDKASGGDKKDATAKGDKDKKSSDKTAADQPRASKPASDKAAGTD